MLLREKEKYEPVVSHLQLMIKSYIQEFGSMDVDIAIVLKKKPIVVPKESPTDFKKLKTGKIYKEGWFIVYQLREISDVDFRKFYFYLEDKHLYNTACLEFILDLITKFKGSHKDDIKCFFDMILWYIQLRKMMLSFVPKIYEVQK
ncbi:unnamed protein product [Lactuca saligna]|uniref:Uncharacterized protein n=1 Tax=Lactuca saligna TaxID=75948 RepID=A0AA35YYE9_LACSI|nr:unnamed protein product [Lactuca saligna]